jgi:hypothetical protein
MRPRLNRETEDLLHKQAIIEGRSDSNMCRVAILRGLRGKLADVAEAMPAAKAGENLDRVVLELPKGVHQQIKFLAKIEDRSARNLMRQLLVRGIRTWPANAAPAARGFADA